VSAQIPCAELFADYGPKVWWRLFHVWEPGCPSLTRRHTERLWKSEGISRVWLVADPPRESCLDIGLPLQLQEMVKVNGGERPSQRARREI
jgi:hypothetical protein